VRAPLDLWLCPRIVRCRLFAAGAVERLAHTVWRTVHAAMASDSRMPLGDATNRKGAGAGEAAGALVVAKVKVKDEERTSYEVCAGAFTILAQPAEEKKEKRKKGAAGFKKRGSARPCRFRAPATFCENRADAQLR
jgi:hypothetical protein